MAEEVIVKRLHISGLTPAINPADLSQRLGSFGTVKALDGFGSVDALDQPRKFGYVTIETTKTKLAKCMNLLSGVTWKGAKLRIGEAKPDFGERLAKEREVLEDGEPPRKKRRLPRGVQGVHASDMSLVSPENATERSGWRVTPLGRIIKPVRMRPEHPLPEPLTIAAQAKAKKGKGKGQESTKKKRRVKETPARARRRTIDPLKWGSTQLKGVFLENAGAFSSESRQKAALLLNEPELDSSEEEESEEEESEEEESEEEEKAVEDDEDESASSADEGMEKEDNTHSVTPKVSPMTVPVFHSPRIAKEPSNFVTSELLQEKEDALGLLQSLFGGREEDDWIGRESFGSDVEMNDQTALEADSAAESNHESEGEEKHMGLATAVNTESEHESNHAEQVSEPERETVDKPNSTKTQKLKDLFAPRPEDAGFSLGQLDLDLELDDDVLDDVFVAAAQPPVVETSHVPIPDVISRQGAHVSFDTTLPFFFPLSEEERSRIRGRAKDPLDAMKEKGWDWRNFCRTQTPEEIKQRWESQKVELTQDWKKRHREAIKSRRRRGGANAD